MIGIGKDDRSSGRVFQLVKRDRSAVDEHFGMSSVGWGQVEGLARKDVAEQPQANLRTRRSEEHTSELQSLMRISYAVFCLKKKKNTLTIKRHYCYNKLTYTNITNTHYHIITATTKPKNPN